MGSMAHSVANDIGLISNKKFLLTIFKNRYFLLVTKYNLLHVLTVVDHQQLEFF